MKKQNQIKILMVVVIVVILCFSDFGFAADEKVYTVGRFLNLIVSFLSWFWVIFAELAGEFLTNKWVYGEVIGLDLLLWKYWTIVRNIANFGLGFYFIYTIFSAFIGKEDIIKRVKDVLIWILIGGVGIQASWFVTAAMIDVSTITLSAVGSLPSWIISNNSKVEADMQVSLSDFVDQNFNATSGMRLTLLPNNGNTNSILEDVLVPVDTTVPKKQLIDMLLPNADDVAGPMYYIGFGILNTNKISSVDLSSLKGAKRTILNMIIIGGTTIVYSIEMFVLCVLALIRIIYLWMFIVLSPLAVLLLCVNKSDKKTGDKIGGFMESITKQINFKSFFINIFKPTIIVLGMSIALIFSVLMKGVATESGSNVVVDLGGVEISSKAVSSDSGESSYDTVISSDFFDYSIKNAAKGLLDMIVSIITVILMYFIIKIAVGIGKSDDFVSKNIKSLQDNVTNVMTSMPIIPVKGYDKYGAENSNAGLSRNGLKSLPSKKLDKMSYTTTQLVNKQLDDVMSGLGFGNDKNLTFKQLGEIENIRKKAEHDKSITLDILQKQHKQIKSFSNNDKTLKTGEGYGMTLAPNASNKFWQEQFIKWLELMDNEDRKISLRNSGDGDIWVKMVEEWKKLESDNKTLQILFAQDRRFIGVYAKLFGLGTISKWEDLIKKDISEKEK